MITSTVVQNYSGLHNRPEHSSKTLPFNPILNLSFSKINRNSAAFNINVGGLGTNLRALSNIKTKRSFVVYSNVEAGNPSPSGPPSGGAWKSWVIGIVITLVLPFFKYKWGPLTLIKNKFDLALQTAENFVETVEKVAEKVEKVAEDMIDELPDGQLKKAATFVEHIAEKAGKHADKLDDFIDKVQEEEEKIDDGIKAAREKAKAKESFSKPSWWLEIERHFLMYRCLSL